MSIALHERVRTLEERIATLETRLALLELPKVGPVMPIEPSPPEFLAPKQHPQHKRS